jgi:excisionase family DNA binding protein
VSQQILLTPERAAEQLDVGRTTVYGLITSGELDSVKIGRSRRIPADALVAYVERLRGQGAAGAA